MRSRVPGAILAVLLAALVGAQPVLALSVDATLASGRDGVNCLVKFTSKGLTAGSTYRFVAWTRLDATAGITAVAGSRGTVSASFAAPRADFSSGVGVDVNLETYRLDSGVWTDLHTLGNFTNRCR